MFFILSNLVLKRLLDKLPVTCPNSDSCKETSQRGILEDHLKYRYKEAMVNIINVTTMITLQVRRNPCCLPVCWSRLRLQVFQPFSLNPIFHFSPSHNFSHFQPHISHLYPISTIFTQPIFHIFTQFKPFSLNHICTQPHFYPVTSSL